mmetsp:Transcript_20637/g.52386  ORF Transcript_20637/g.52386 Transcript_20637/m.52386 type:complete len:303 (-) Transcript_20637:1316-2224(-)
MRTARRRRRTMSSSSRCRRSSPRSASPRSASGRAGLRRTRPSMTTRRTRKRRTSSATSTPTLYRTTRACTRTCTTTASCRPCRSLTARWKSQSAWTCASATSTNGIGAGRFWERRGSRRDRPLRPPRRSNALRPARPAPSPNPKLRTKRCREARSLPTRVNSCWRRCKRSARSVQHRCKQRREPRANGRGAEPTQTTTMISRRRLRVKRRRQSSRRGRRRRTRISAQAQDDESELEGHASQTTTRTGAMQTTRRLSTRSSNESGLRVRGWRLGSRSPSSRMSRSVASCASASVLIRETESTA